MSGKNENRRERGASFTNNEKLVFSFFLTDPKLFLNTFTEYRQQGYCWVFGWYYFVYFLGHAR